MGIVCSSFPDLIMKIAMFQWQILLGSDVKLFKLCLSAVPLPGSIPNLFLGKLLAVFLTGVRGGGTTFTDQSKDWYRGAG
jgi:hypothetical protein